MQSSNTSARQAFGADEGNLANAIELCRFKGCSVGVRVQFCSCAEGYQCATSRSKQASTRGCGFLSRKPEGC